VSVPEDDKHVTWAKAADPSITRVKVAPDSSYPGRLHVTVAGISNPLSGGVVAAAQLYIDQREQIGDISLVAAATVVTVTARAVVRVPALALTFIQENGQQQWDAYVNNAEVGGVIRRATFEQILMDLGAISVDDLTINTFFANLELGVNEIGQADDIISSNVTWVAV
jgi:hypothetical protein